MRLKYFIHKKRKKGWVLIYVIVVAAFMLFTITYVLKGLEGKSNYLTYYKNTIINEDLKHKKKEYLMTEFNSYMRKNLKVIKEMGMDEYFIQNDISKYLATIERDGMQFKDKCNIKYNSRLKIFELTTGTYTYGFYPIIEDENIKYKFVVIN